MKKIIFLMLLLPLLTFITIKAQWEYLGDNGFGNCEAFCLAVDSNCTLNGTDCGIWTTTNYGDWWVNRDTTYTVMGVEVLATDGNVLYAGTDFDGIYISTDKGYNWIQKNNGLPPNSTWFGRLSGITSILLKDNNIFIGTDEGVYLSTNSGENWTEKNNGLDTVNHWGSEIAIMGDNIYAGTANGVFLSTDNGIHWTSKNDGLSNMWVYGLVANDKNLYVITKNGGVNLSTDNGDNWKNIGLQNKVTDVLYVKDNYIFVADYDDSIYVSTNNGLSWIVHNNGFDGSRITSFIINGDYVFASTIFSSVWRAKLSELITDVEEQNDNTNSGFEIYPNPASSSVRVKYESSTYSKLQISIFDLLGNEVFNTTEYCNIGMNEKTIDCSSLATGYYIIQLKQGERVEAKPVVILK